MATKRRRKEESEEATNDLAEQGGSAASENAELSGHDEAGASDSELPAREDPERSVPPAEAVAGAGAAKEMPVSPEVLENFRRQLMRRTFVGHKEALTSLTDVPYEVLRPAVEGLLPEGLRPFAANIVAGELTTFDLGLLAVSLLAAYHQGYAVAQADILQGYDYHAALGAELGTADAPPQ